MEEREGAIWVTNPSEPLWPDDGRPRIEFELEQVFGADETPEEALLGSTPWIAVDDVGRVYVVDGIGVDRHLVLCEAADRQLVLDQRHHRLTMRRGDVQERGTLPPAHCVARASSGSAVYLLVAHEALV